MARAVSKEEAENFIQTIAPHAIDAYKTLGKVWPSICIAMACVECGYGTAGSCKYNSYLGQKVGSGKTATTYWSGRFFNSKTKEEYILNVHTIITAAFRAYDDIRQCVFNYYELLNSNVYKGVKAGVPYTEQMAQIKACGYMTSSTEVGSVLNIIEKYGLTKYDAQVASGGDGIIKPVASYTRPVLHNGAKGEWVRVLQTKLVEAGYKISIDGIYGPKTRMAVLMYQEAQGLQVDGIVGRKTWARLYGEA
jgi:hypothetical protein